MPACELYPGPDIGVVRFLGSIHLSRECASLWSRLPPLHRVTWCHAALINGEECLSSWAALSREEQTALMTAIENLKEFFEAAGA